MLGGKTIDLGKGNEDLVELGEGSEEKKWSEKEERILMKMSANHETHFRFVNILRIIVVKISQISS